MQTSKVLSNAAHIRRLQYQWSQDRALQKRVPLSRSWRGCLGLAILLDNPDDTYSHGDMALVRNEQLAWLAMRDIPGCPTAKTAGRLNLGSSHVTTANGCLRYGMAVLDFTTNARDAINFRRLPQWQPNPMTLPSTGRTKASSGDILNAGDIQRFSALNRLSSAMTRFAQFGTDVSGIPWQPIWNKYRPDDGEPYVTPKPAAWMPQPFLGFTLTEIERVCNAALTTVMDGSPPKAIYDGFSRSLADGMILGATGPEIYCGVVSTGPNGRIHQLRSTIDQASRFVAVPGRAKLLVKPGEILEPAQPWIRVMTDVRHRHQPDSACAVLPALWAKLRCLCGGTARFKKLLQLWLEHQFIRVESQPSVVLIPTSLVASVAGQLSPAALWWDTQPMLAHYDWEIQVAVLPPVPLRGWDGLRISLPGEVAVNASVVDPRWNRPRIWKAVDMDPMVLRGAGIEGNLKIFDAAIAQRPRCSHESGLAVAG